MRAGAVSESEEPSNKPVAERNFKPEIAKLAKKRVVSLIPVIATSIALSLLIVFIYIFYFKDFGESKPDSNVTAKSEISRKEFIFKDAEPKEIKESIEVEKNTSVGLDLKKEIITHKPVFQKYKSIPLKSEAAESTDSADKEKNAKEVNKENEAEEIVVRAEKIAIDPDFLLCEGTYIPCSLTTRFTSEVNGRITCTISEDVYSASSKVKLIEKGTRAIGIYQGGDLKHGVGRMFVIWTKLITPDFKRIKLVDSQVVGQLGEAGIDGWIDSHFFQRFGGAILLSTVKDIIKATTGQNQKKENNTTVNINTMDETKDAFVSIIEKMLENSVNIPPTMYKNQGDIIGIMVGKDIDFSRIYKLKINK